MSMSGSPEGLGDAAESCEMAVICIKPEPPEDNTGLQAAQYRHTKPRYLLEASLIKDELCNVKNEVESFGTLTCADGDSVRICVTDIQNVDHEPYVSSNHGDGLSSELEKTKMTNITTKVKYEGGLSSKLEKTEMIDLTTTIKHEGPLYSQPEKMEMIHLTTTMKGEGELSSELEKTVKYELEKTEMTSSNHEEGHSSDINMKDINMKEYLTRYHQSNILLTYYANGMPKADKLLAVSGGTSLTDSSDSESEDKKQPAKNIHIIVCETQKSEVKAKKMKSPAIVKQQPSNGAPTGDVPAIAQATVCTHVDDIQTYRKKSKKKYKKKRARSQWYANSSDDSVDEQSRDPVEVKRKEPKKAGSSCHRKKKKVPTATLR